ncbi:MAG: dTDP-glucose 4,6-dehydratase [Nitrososphaerota archaeon]|nr:dTDP-glucose 4,6-dehydratase [Nitrososphaerota archaeon]
MDVLVTGGLGFIGSNFIRNLMIHGDVNCVNLDAMTYGSNPANLDDVSASGKYKFVKGDIANEKDVCSLLDEADAVVNIAAQTHVDRSVSSGAPFVRSNVIGVFTILDALRRAGRRIPFVQVGTDEEYGEIDDGSFVEGDPLAPSSPYAATKASAAMLVMAYARTYGLDAKVTRCTNNYGPYQFPEKLIPKSVIRAHLGLKVPVYGDGLNSRDWIHVEDHCEALELVMRRGKPGSVYNIAGGNEMTNLDLVKMILKAMKKPESLIEFVEDRPGHDKRYSLNDEKIRNELGWKPKHRFESGLEETIQWYLENKKWWRPIANEKTLSVAPWKLEW